MKLMYLYMLTSVYLWSNFVNCKRRVIIYQLYSLLILKIL